MNFAALANDVRSLHEEALAWRRRGLEANRNSYRLHLRAAFSLVELGRLDEAREAVEAGLALHPHFTIARALVSRLFDDPRYQTFHSRYLEALREAGVPES